MPHAPIHTTMTTQHPQPQAKDYILAISPYVPGKAALQGVENPIKLSSNENPIGTSAKALQAFSAAHNLARYPDPSATALREALALHHGLEPERIIYGTGSDELLNIAASAYAGIGDEIIYVRYAFSAYDIAIRRAGATPVVVEDADYGTNIDALLSAVTPRTKLVFLANPNNPTGSFCPRTDIARLHAGLRSDIVLVLDQAYAEYLEVEEDDGGLDLARTAGNILVTRTFSKIYGLAAERIGWGYGAPAIIDALHRIRAPFNVTNAGQAAAIAALADTDFVAESRTLNAQGRQALADALKPYGNQGVRVLPSHGNFLLVLFEGAITAEHVNTALMQHGIIVRWLPGQGLPQALRITIGTPQENAAVIAALKDILA
jgi:histidinol-phosphate aminotransferase